MKKLSIIGISLLFLSFTSQGIAQVEGFYAVHLTEANFKPVNTNYFEQVFDQNTSYDVKQLQREVALYDIKESEEFDSKMDSMDVLFKEKGGDHSRVLATFDNEGNIIKSYEKHNNVFLPREVRNAIVKQYQGWTLAQTTYKVNYFNDKNVDKAYFVRIEKDGKRKNLKVDSSGRLL
ncbi:hypothetical protein [Mangrovimonas sp. ST2L15]|uniref:hypothetical protein n=1 Tax=Mangrovimonas sp. ST2L15 TaxID=1645916 RepID=UPI0006B619C5|nr:hypothetical protein [Mangrovimonas sp. ST2L15]